MTTKIIATIGPKTENIADLRKIISAGVSYLRINFSHASFEQYKRIHHELKIINRDLKTKVAIILDLQGPRIRVGHLPAAGLNLHEGEVLRFAYFPASHVYDGSIIPIDNPNLYLDIKKNNPLFLCNGEIELLVLSVKNKVISARVIKGGWLLSHKGINIPDTNLRAGGLTVKDIKDAKFGIKVGVDYIALSFVQTQADVLKLRRLIGDKKIKIISKIERGIALKNIDAIIQASDAIMVARGDLGIEVPIEDLPIIQKNLVRHAHWHDKPAIIATQVLTSMIKNPHPTRAEISDIANAVLDGADMIMLSDETAVGEFGPDAVRILKKVIDRTIRYVHKGNVSEG